MFRTPSACAPSRIDSSPVSVMSRGVRCGIVSTPVKRSIATEAMTPLMRARARGLSLTSTNCALFVSRTARAVSINASGFAPSGGSSWTETTNVPSPRRRSSSVLPPVVDARDARRDAGDRLAFGVEGHQGDDGQARHATDRRDRALEIVEVEERLHHEEVGAAALEDLRLLRVTVRGVGADRAGDEHVAARD